MFTCLLVSNYRVNALKVFQPVSAAGNTNGFISRLIVVSVKLVVVFLYSLDTDVVSR